MVEAYFANAKAWRAELLELRRIMLALGLQERLKWRQPCYVSEGKNVAILGTRKDACVLSLFEGALLSDPEGLLVAPGPNSRSGRLLRFGSVDEIRAREAIVGRLVREASEHARAGTKVALGESPEVAAPEELRRCLEGDPALKAAFEALTPGRRRGYLLHFGGAKGAATRTRRILEARDRILQGKGLHDCICGRSARMPRCDGSHRAG